VLLFLQETNQKYVFVSPENKSGVVPVHTLIAREKPGADNKAGLEKTRVFKKNQPSGFFWFIYIYIFAQKREFLGFFSVSRILLGASRL
jgi:hypothetical protein